MISRDSRTDRKELGNTISNWNGWKRSLFRVSRPKGSNDFDDDDDDNDDDDDDDNDDID